ncbi:DUF6752 domain-containing protein [Nocardioides pacificus]
MTDRVFLHVGAPKSGTTYLQQVLRDNRSRLQEAGVLVAGGPQVELVHAAMVLREDPRLDKLPPRARGAWQRIVDEVRHWSGHTAVVSYELLAGATAEQAQRAIDDLAGIEVHIVVTCRDLGRAVASGWQERLKFALATPLEQWVPKPESAARSEWGWRTMDPAGVTARWGAGLPPGQVHVVTGAAGGAPEQLWQRFAAATGLDAVPLQLPPARSNTSLGAAASEVLRRVNEHVAAPLDTNREQARWLRDVLAHQVLAPLDGTPLAITAAQLADAQDHYTSGRAAIERAGYRVHGDLADLAPSETSGPTPAEVPVEEVLDVAVRALLDVLLRLREGADAPGAAGAGGDETLSSPAAAPGGAANPPAGLLGRGKNLVSGAYAARVRSEVDELRGRVEELEAELARSRALQPRLAMVTDLVSELLLPDGARDEETLRAGLETYRRETL